MMRLGIMRVTIPEHRALRWNLGYFTDSSRMMFLRGTLGSSLGGSFLVPRITYFGGVGQIGSEHWKIKH